MNDRTRLAAEFAAALMARVEEYTTTEAIVEGFKAADKMLALSAPDAIEALKTLVEAVKYMGLSYDSYVSKTVREAGAVLARYEKEPG